MCQCIGLVITPYLHPLEGFHNTFWVQVRLGLGLELRLMLGLSSEAQAGGVGGSVLVATPDSVHSTFLKLQLLMPQHHIHVPPRP